MIQTKTTPNPDSLKFLSEKVISAVGTEEFHKDKQNVKGKGRYNFTPIKEECIDCDCDANGLMIFNGRDHIHYREKLEYDYYNILLLHYKGYDD